MKKLIALLLALALAVCCVACAPKGDGKADGKTDGKTEPTESTEDTEDTEGTGSTEPTDPTEPTEPVVKEGIYLIDSFTVSDADAQAKRNTPVATVGTSELTNGLLQIFYWSEVYNFLGQYGAYAIYYGLDYTKPLEEQAFDQKGSWQHYFLESALNTWRAYQSMAEAAYEAGFQMPAEVQAELDKIPEETEKAAKELGYESAEAMIVAQMGAGCTLDDYLKHQEIYLYSYAWFEHLYAQLSFSQEDIDKYFAEHEEELKKSGVTKDSGLSYAVRHILVPLEGGTKDDKGNTTYSDADWENCRVKAQAILDEWLAGDRTEDSFAALANEHSTDPGSNTNGGLYDGLNKDTNFVPNFKNWYLDETRQPGDYGLVTSDYGYHIMYFSGTEDAWIYTCREALMSEASSAFVSDAVKAHEMDLDHEKIVLGNVDLKAVMSSGDSE